MPPSTYIEQPSSAIQKWHSRAGFGRWRREERDGGECSRREKRDGGECSRREERDGGECSRDGEWHVWHRRQSNLRDGREWRKTRLGQIRHVWDSRERRRKCGFGHGRNCRQWRKLLEMASREPSVHAQSNAEDYDECIAKRGHA